MNATLQKFFRAFKIFFALLFFIIIISSSIFAIYKLYNPKTFPIENIAIQIDSQNVNKEQLEKIITPVVKDGFFAVNLKFLKSRLQKIIGVSEAQIRKIWPNKIIIDITSEKSFAYWNQNKIVNAYGEVFALNGATINNDLPKFFGPEDSLIKIVDTYVQMNKILRSLNMRVVEIRLSISESFSVVLDNGVKLQLGRDQVLTKLQRFVKVYPKIVASNNKQAKTFDLRYEHGVAVEW